MAGEKGMCAISVTRATGAIQWGWASLPTRKWPAGTPAATIPKWTWASQLTASYWLLGLLAWAWIKPGERVSNLAGHRARAHFDRDRAFRLWGASHGGVYVPVDEQTPPNPHLAHIQERDIRTPSGRGLTLMNPAYMIRQLQEEFSELYGAKGRITSLKPLREKNSPDEWEKKALESFEKREARSCRTYRNCWRTTPKTHETLHDRKGLPEMPCTSRIQGRGRSRWNRSFTALEFFLTRGTSTDNRDNRIAQCDICHRFRGNPVWNEKT